jgi:hypothetical protein
MRDIIGRHRPAPGTVLGLIALIVALAGTAIADPLATDSKLGKKDKKQIRKIARKQINRAAPNLSVDSAQNATNATNAISAQNAANAASAQNAANAASAQNATNAANAGAVDGHSAVCPAGTFLQNGVCFDTAVRFDMVGWIGATQNCADAGGYLPSISELQSIRTLVDLGTAGNGHWADVAWDDDGTLEAMTVSQAAGTTEPVVIAGAFRQARCAFHLVR